MPAYGSQAATNSPLTAIRDDQVAPVTFFSAEVPVAGQASIAAALMPATPDAQLAPVAFRFSCPLGIGAGVFQIQDADVDAAPEYDSISFGGGSPGQITSASMNASGVARVELILRSRFVRILCVTAPSNAITVTAV
jgi:hypothetical protein